MNGEPVSCLSHDAALDRLRRVGRGETVQLLVSRVAEPRAGDELVLGGSLNGRLYGHSSAFPERKAFGLPEPASESGSLHVAVPRLLADEAHSSLDSSSPTTESSAAAAVRVLALDIALNDTGSAGLGVSVKGRYSRPPVADHRNLPPMPEPFNAPTAAGRSAASS